MNILRIHSAPTNPIDIPLDTTQAEPFTPCPECGKPLWCWHDFETGTDEKYCPTCTVYEPTRA